MPTRQAINTEVSVNPVIIWHSDPVKANETVMIQGDGFTDACMAELHRLDDSAAGLPAEPPGDNAGSWVRVRPAVRSADNLMFVLPEQWPQAVIACRLSNGKGSSKTVFINAPDSWWMQGDLGTDGSPGGWLRVIGKCLNFGGASQVLLKETTSGSEQILKAVEADCYSMNVRLPDSLAEGHYEVMVHNGLGGHGGWKPGGRFIIRQPVRWKTDVFNVTDFGAASYYADKDSTLAVKAAIQRAADNGGGVVYFPRGRYKITEVLNIPPYVTLKGEGMGLVSLFWPDMPVPLTSLVWGKHSFAVEDLALYAQGSHYNVISGEDNVRVQRVRIRACAFLGSRKVEVDPGGAGLYLTGKNIVVTDCDILHTCVGLFIHRPEGALIARNSLHGNCSYMSALCVRSMIFEENESTDGGCGVPIYACGWGLSLYDANACQHLYFAHNTLRRCYRGDREIITTDGQGTAYFGRIQSAQGREVTLAADPQWRTTGRAGMVDWKASMTHFLKNQNTFPGSDLVVLEQNPPQQGLTLFILGGRGAGQYRRLVGCEGRQLTMERPWEVEPDETSVVSLAKFNGRHLIVGNTFEDAGPIQLYPPNYECIVAENRSRRCGNFVSWGLLCDNQENYGGMTADASWYNQFLDNVVEEGNAWGGEVTVMNIIAINTEPDYPVPASRCQIVRRHVGENNSSIRIDGAVEGGLVENCVIKNNYCGIEVKSWLSSDHPHSKNDTRWKVKGKKEVINTLNTPGNILLRHNRFEAVEKAYTGNAINTAVRED